MKRGIGVTAILVVLLLLGYGVASGLTSALGISSRAKDVPTERPTVAPVRTTVVPPAITVTSAPAGERTDLATTELADALASGPTRGAATLVVTAGDGDEDDDTYRLLGTPTALRVEADSLTGAVRGIYDLAAAVRDGRSVTDELGQSVSSRLPFRMADLGAAGVTPDPAVWRKGTDYSHSSGAFRDVLLPHAPFVDQRKLAEAKADVDAYAAHLLAEGYNAIAVPGFLEYLTLDGTGVYAKGDEHVARAKAMQASFGPIWQHLHDLGLKVYFRTDMLALSTPLERYFAQHHLGPEDAAFWQVYERGLDELYRAMPYVDGTLLRIGEAGRVYDDPGWDYYSELKVTTVQAVRAMLTAFTAEADRSDKDVIFRSWSVGVGAVGDMHTNPASYHAVLDGLDSPHLVVSTKYSLGDFYSHLPLNDTLETGSQRRIVELQSRREFEGSGALPNDLGPLYAEALRTFLAKNPHVEGIWTWTQDGGPWRAGPMSLELKTGFWQLYELNTELAVRLARDPGIDPAQVTADWARRWFSDDPATVAAIGNAMALSREAISTGLYVGPYADRYVKAIGLEPPPMMWIFEWDILTGDSAVLDVVYAVSRDARKLDEAIDEGRRAVEVAEQMRRVGSAPGSTWKDQDLRSRLLRSLDYEVDLFRVLASYRAAFLRHAEWLDTGSDRARGRWKEAEHLFELRAADHEKRYGGDLDLPAYNLTAARIGLERADRDPAMGLSAWIALGLLALWFVAGALRLQRAAAATWLAGTRPWRAAEAVADLSRRDRALVAGVPLLALVASRGIATWFDAPAHLLITGLAWLVFAAGLALAVRRRDPWPVIAAVGGAVLLRVALLLVALRGRGPGGYWFAFWTEPTQRTIYVTLAVAAFGWVLVAAAWSARAVGAVVAAAGLALVVCGAFVGAIGLERALTTWNDQMALLPWGLSRILGITVYLGIPTALPWWVAGFGLVLVVGGLVPTLIRAGRRTPRARRRSARRTGTAGRP